MCGIYGILSLSDSEPPGPNELARMASVTRHRGPDDEGSYHDGRIAIGMRRLSIIDVEGGHQPLSNIDQTIWVVCNGEIYNFRELRQRLTRQGHQFRSHSDSEVIVHAYVEYGDRFVDHLDGMFGFALWDAKRQRLVIGRDRLGIKPIYFLNDGRRLIFASEAKAILQVPGVSAELDPAALRHYLALGYVPSPRSMFRHIRKLPVASTLTAEGGEIEIARYWNLPVGLDETRDEREWIELLLRELERAVVSQMVSDVPIGAFLSGGLDSSTVVGFMARNSDRPIKTYAIGFDAPGAGQFFNELPHARQVSRLFRTDHHEILVRPDVVKLLPKLLWQMDEPVADSAFITTYLVAEFARRDVTVILSGVGGDELFGGYFRYLGENYLRFYRLLPRVVREGLVQPVARRLPADRHSRLMNLSRLARSFLLAAELPPDQRYRSYVGVFDDSNLSRLLIDDDHREADPIVETFASLEDTDSVKQLLAVDLETQLPDDLLLLTDRMTMATSLECRVPLLDHTLVERVAQMPTRLKIRGNELKSILKKALADLLPPEVLYRKKRGFGAPVGAWFKTDLSALTRQLLSPRSIENRGLLRPDVVAETIASHNANIEDHTDHLLALINLELWARIFLDGRTPEDLTDEVGVELKQ